MRKNAYLLAKAPPQRLRRIRELHPTVLP